MNIPQTWTEYLIWVGVQFPVVAAVFVIAKWFRADVERRHVAELDREEQRHAAALADKDRVYVALLAEKDKQLAKAEAEVAFLRERFYPSRRRDRDEGKGPS